MSVEKYPSLRNVGDRYTQGLFAGPVVVQEKVDGSQISFSVDDDGNLSVRSRRGELDLDNPGLFRLAVDQLNQVKNDLSPSLIYHGEFLRSPKHNLNVYERTPLRNIVIFDIQVEGLTGGSRFVDPRRASGLNQIFDIAPVIFEGLIENAEHLESLVSGPSFLGNDREGIVVKNYGSEIFAKYVTANFKERMKAKVKKFRDPMSVEHLFEEFVTEARWSKAIQHLRDDGLLDGTMKDMGLLVKEVQRDVFEEHEEEMKDILFEHFRKKIRGQMTDGLANFYKELIHVNAFEAKEDV